jgi:hypothetical protein
VVKSAHRTASPHTASQLPEGGWSFSPRKASTIKSLERAGFEAAPFQNNDFLDPHELAIILLPDPKSPDPRP